MGQMTRAFISRQQIDLIASQALGALLRGATEQDIFEASAVQKYELGARKVLNHGGLSRVFYYGKIHPSADDGSGGVGRGRVVMSSDDGVERGAFLGAQTVGAKSVTWTSVGTFLGDHYKNGFALLQGGFVREIKSHPAAAAPGTLVTLQLFDPLPETIGAGRYALIQQNPYANLYSKGGAGVHPNHEGCVMGVTTFDILQAYYAWVQTWGPCGVISNNSGLGNADEEFDIRHGMNPGDEVNVVTVADGTVQAYQKIGNLLIANAVNWDNENFIIVDLTIRP